MNIEESSEKSSDEKTSVEMELKDKDVEIRIGKTMRLLDTTFFSIGVIVGSGIFVGVGTSYNVFTSDNILMVVIFWIAAGSVSLMGGLCYAEFGTRMPQSGGERNYYRKALRSEFSITFVVMYLFVVKVLTMSGLAVASGEYLSSIIGKENMFVKKTIAVVTLSICNLVNCCSKKVVTKLGNTLTFIKIAAMLIIIIIGFVFLGRKNLNDMTFELEFKGFKMNNLVICILNLLWTNEGANMVGFIAGDMVNPSRDLPIAIGLSGIVVTTLYTLTAVCYSFVIGFDRTREGSNVATLVARTSMGKAFFILPILVYCSASGAVLGTFYAVSSVCVASALEGEIPKVFGMVDKNKRTASFTSIIIYTGALFFVPLPFQTLLRWTSVMSWLFYFISYTTLLKLKISTRNQNIPNIFSANYIMVIFMILLSFSVIISCFYVELFGSSIFVSITILVFSFQFIPNKFLPTDRLTYIQDKVMIFLSKHYNLVIAEISDVS